MVRKKKKILTYSNLRNFLSDHTGFTSDLPKPLLIKEGKSSPHYQGGVRGGRSGDCLFNTKHDKELQGVS
jgi:hypothetical protein